MPDNKKAAGKLGTPAAHATPEVPALPFGEKKKRLVAIWKELDQTKTMKEVAAAYKAKFGGEAPTDQTISNAKQEAFNLKPVKSKEPTLENLAALYNVLLEKGVSPYELKTELDKVQENPFEVYDQAAGGRGNLKELLAKLVLIKGPTSQPAAQE